MVIRALDIVPACNTSAQGAAVADKLRPFLIEKKNVVLSFSGVSDVPSSFINASIVALFNELSADVVIRHLSISDVTNQIAGMIRRCVENSQRGDEAA